jgi:hypothetical protein
MDLSRTVFDPMLDAAEPLIEIAPRLLAFTAVIVAGLILSYLFKRLVVLFAKALNFDVLSYRTGLTSLMSKIWYDRTPAEILGRFAYWFVLLLFLLLGISVLHVETLNRLVASAIAWVPLLVVTLVILTVGYFISRFIGTAALIALVNSQYKSASLIAFLVRGIILVFFVAIAAEHLGVGRGIVVATFAIVLGGVVLALAIAFGLGGRDIARDVLEKKLRSLEERNKGSDEISHL